MFPLEHVINYKLLEKNMIGVKQLYDIYQCCLFFKKFNNNFAPYPVAILLYPDAPAISK